MNKKRILFLDPNIEQTRYFVDLLKDSGYELVSSTDIGGAFTLISKETFDLLIMDIDSPSHANSLLDLCGRIKAEPSLSDLPVTLLANKKDAKKIADALKAGVDNFMLKPFETEILLNRINMILREFELKKQRKKLFDQNYINFLIGLMKGTSREDFFMLSTVIINNLILDKIMPIMGEPIIIVILNRLHELSEGKDYYFMRMLKFEAGQILLDEANHASIDKSVEALVHGFKNYLDMLLRLVQALTSDILVEKEPGS